MGVTLQNVTKWPLPIPYKSKDPLEQKVLENFNKDTRRTFFVDHVDHNGSADVTVLEFDSASPGRCHIGFTKGEKVRIVAYSPGQGKELNDLNKARTLLHELGHCIGLAHEQCHEDYAWDYRETIRDSRTHVAQMPLNKELVEAFWAVDGKGMYSYKMIAIAEERQRHQYADLTAYCDYESIMMYDIYHTAALAAKDHLPTPAATADLLGKLNRIPPNLAPRDRLSGNDVRSIRLLYAL